MKCKEGSFLLNWNDLEQLEVVRDLFYRKKKKAFKRSIRSISIDAGTGWSVGECGIYPNNDTHRITILIKISLCKMSFAFWYGFQLTADNNQQIVDMRLSV